VPRQFHFTATGILVLFNSATTQNWSICEWRTIRFENPGWEEVEGKMRGGGWWEIQVYTRQAETVVAYKRDIFHGRFSLSAYRGTQTPPVLPRVTCPRALHLPRPSACCTDIHCYLVKGGGFLLVSYTFLFCQFHPFLSISLLFYFQTTYSWTRKKKI
jgi:hypothetical protein